MLASHFSLKISSAILALMAIGPNTLAESQEAKAH